MGRELRDATWAAIAAGAIPPHLHATCLRIAETTRDDRKLFYASSETLAAELGGAVSSRSIRRRLQAIAEAGFMTLNARGNQHYPNVWFVHPDRGIAGGEVVALAIDTPKASDAMRDSGHVEAKGGTR